MDRTPLIADLPLSALCRELRSGARTPEDLAESLCARADAIEARLRSLLPEPARRSRLRREARELRERFPDPQARPPLYGVPVAIKDIIAVRGFETNAGSRLPSEEFEMPEGPAVERLRDAGALILGKTVTTQFAYLDPGATTNPHNPKHTPGGSSSGSAAAVAAGIAPLALGSQTAGSVNRPAAFCGCVGFKPSFDRIPTDGVLACAPSYDTIGVFTQDVAGMAIASSVLLDDWRSGVSARADRPPILGVPDGAYLEQMQPASRGAFEKQLAGLEAAGIRIERVHCLAEIEEIGARHRNLMSVEFARVHEDRFARFAPLFAPHAAMLVDRAHSLGPGAENRGRAGRAELRGELESLMREEGFDLYIAPAAPGPAPSGLQTTGDARMNVPWTQAGMPCLGIPAGHARSGLPLGVQVIAGFGRDEELLAWAPRLESVLRAPALREIGRSLEAPEHIGE